MRVCKPLLVATCVFFIAQSLKAQTWQYGTGTTYFMGNVGIGTANPSTPFSVFTNFESIASFKTSSSNNTNISVSNAIGQLNLGIGSATPHPYAWSNTNNFFIGSDGNPT